MLFVIAAAVFFTACEKEKNKAGVFKGPEVQIHEGKAWSWVSLDADGNPLQIGVAIDESAMESVPTDTTGMPNTGHGPANNFTLKLHPKASVTPFKHIGLDWNPVGHEPAGIYTKSHFDFHFYMMPEADRLAIPTYEQDSAKFKNLPNTAYYPQTYIAIPGGLPRMGAHWIDVTSPELAGQPFTQTFIFGSFDGKVTFYEPMITKEFLENNSNYERQIPQPAKYQETGYYPTIMRVVKKDGLTNVILDGFKYRQAS